MRLVVGMLAVLLSSSIALAEEAVPSRLEAKAEAPASARQRVPVRVVRILPETNQALLFDRSSGGTHLLVTVGDKIGIYTVEAIEDDEVTLSGNGQQIVLAAPDRPWRRRNREDRARSERPRAVRGGEPAPVPGPADPYGGPADPYGGPADPYQTPSTGAPSSVAPSTGTPGPADPYAVELREVKAPKWIDPAAPTPATPTSPMPTPALAPAPAIAPPPVPAMPPLPPPALVPPPALAPTPAIAPAPAIVPAPASPAIGPAIAPAPAGDPVLARREVDAALADFSALAVAFRASFTPAGVKVESILDGSLFAKAGLRAGDVIASVEGRPLRSLDDVAGLYSRAGSLRTVTAQVVRGGKPLALRVVIQ
jgi:hypothetical protein